MDFLRRTWAEIDIDALRNNFCIIKSKANSVYPVVKADAYGHGAVAIAAVLADEGASGFAVSNIEEAEELRAAGIRQEILVLGYTPAECAKRLAQNNISQCVFSSEYAHRLNSEASTAGVTVRVHLKLDTGMGRIGFDCRSSEFLGLQEAKNAMSLSNLDTVGAFFHFAVADSTSAEDIQFTTQQYQRFMDAVSALEKEGYQIPLKHCCNSAATLCSERDDKGVVRAGIILYGLAPSEEIALPDGMKPVMALYSVVSMIKSVEKNETIGYGRTYVAKQKQVIATVSAGYADGVPRLLSNCGRVLIHGQYAPIVGRVCMDQFCVDVSHIPEVSLGDQVTIFGPGLSVDEVAKNAQTINYEIVCGITKRVPRIYINSILT